MIKFVKYQKICFVASILFLCASALGYWYNGGFRYGVDFTGGTELRIKFAKDVDIALLRNTVGDAEQGFAETSIQSVSGNSEFIVKIGQDDKTGSIGNIQNKLETLIQGKIGVPFEVTSVEHVGPEAGKEVRGNTIVSILLVLLSLLLYIAVRYRYDYAVGAVAALAHDVLVVLGVYVMLGIPFTLNILAALLALLGYSLNDTIVVYSRIHDNAKMPGLNADEIVDLSINQTLRRTLLTSFATFLSMVAVYLFGGAVLHDFALTMLVGIVTGTYSSIYIASSVMLLLSPNKRL